jgi:hypothetical protein
MHKKNNGFASTISVVLLLIALLSLVFAISHYSNMEKESNSNLARISDVQSQYDSVYYGTRQIVEQYGTRASINSSHAIFTQQLSAYNKYWQSLDGWDNFVAQHGKYGITLTSLSLTNDELPAAIVYLQSGNLTANHSKNQPKFSLSYPSGSIRNYSITINVSDPSAYINATPTGFTSSNGTPVYLNVGFCCGGANTTSTNPIYLNSSLSSPPYTLKIVSPDNSTSNLTVGPSLLKYDYSPGRNAYLTIDAELNPQPSYADILGAGIRSENGGIKKQGTVHLG